ncbi:MAG: hypothetical protein R3B06_27695 [Kofleriaceae bacterium]
MPIERAAMAAVLVACGIPDGGATLVRREDPPAIRARCALADQRCTQCHPLDRVLALAPAARDDWRGYVHRMRLTPGSAIDPVEEAPIVACLQYRSFGPMEAP